MNKLGDNDELGVLSLGGFRIAGSALREPSARRGSVLFSARREFSVIGAASADKAGREVAAGYSASGGSRGGRAKVIQK